LTDYGEEEILTGLAGRHINIYIYNEISSTL